MNDAGPSAPHRVAVTVLLPVYDAGEYLLPAVESILTQTFRDFELLLIDDGSRDGAVERLAETVHDPRLRVVRQANAGLAATLNVGLALAQGGIVVRMDADDVARPDRIALQVAALRADPGLVLVGGQLTRIVGAGHIDAVTRFPLSHDRIVAGLLRREHVLSHPAVAFRTDAARAIGGYWAAGPSEDWDLFLRMASAGTLANRPEVVLDYRFHASGINASGLFTVRRNMRLATVNHRRRQAGRAELPLSAFTPWPYAMQYAGIWREAQSLRHYRSSLRLRAEGRRGTAALHLAASATLWPEQAARRVLPVRREHAPVIGATP